MRRHQRPAEPTAGGALADIYSVHMGFCPIREGAPVQTRLPGQLLVWSPQAQVRGPPLRVSLAGTSHLQGPSAQDM